MGGRPKLPTAIKEAKGTLKKCRVNALEPVLSKSAPTPPSELSPLAKSYFKKVCQLMDEMNTLTVADIFIIQVLSQELARNKELNAELKSLGSFTYKTSNKLGDEMHRAYPQLAAIADSNRLIIQLLGKCGLSPADRQNVQAIPTNKVDEREQTEIELLTSDDEDGED